MESFYSSIGLFMDGIGLVLSLILIYNRYYFHNNKKENKNKFLHAIPLVVCLLCVFEMLNYPSKGHSMMVLYQVFEYIEGILECLLVGLTIQFMLESVPACSRLNDRTNFKKNFLLCTVVVLISLCGHVIYSVKTTGSGLNYHMLFHARWALFVIMVLLMVIFFVKSLKNRDKESAFQLLTLLLCSLLAVVVGEIELSILTINWTGDGMGYALGYTLLYTVASTRLMVDSKEKEATLLADVNMAKNIQQDALPKDNPAFPHHRDVEVSALMATARDVGGDFYDYFEIDDNRICFLIADVSGKGMPASLFMMTAKTMLKTIAMQAKNTSEIISRVNRLLAANNASMMFVTVWIGILNTETMELEYTNAAHNPPVIIHADGSDEILGNVHGTVIGLRNSNIYTRSTLKMHTKDRIFLYTDGVTEAHNVHDELFGEERMIKELNDKKDADGDALIKDMKGKLDDFSLECDQFDDITMMAIDIRIVEEVFDGMDFLANL